MILADSLHWVSDSFPMILAGLYSVRFLYSVKADKADWYGRCASKYGWSFSVFVNTVFKCCEVLRMLFQLTVSVLPFFPYPMNYFLHSNLIGTNLSPYLIIWLIVVQHWYLPNNSPFSNSVTCLNTVTCLWCCPYLQVWAQIHHRHHNHC